MPGFVEDLASLFIKDIGLKGFCLFGIRLRLSSEKMNGKFSLLFYFLEEFGEDRCDFFLSICLIEFTTEDIWTWSFLCRKFSKIF